MLFTVKPAACKAVIALSRPLPGPFTRTSTSLTPNLLAFSAHCCAAHWPAKGVLLRLPLKPQVPALAQHSVSPLVSVIVTVVLLNVAFTCATPKVTFRRTFRRLLLDIIEFSVFGVQYSASGVSFRRPCRTLKAERGTLTSYP